jgi:hypothetical protein
VTHVAGDQRSRTTTRSSQVSCTLAHMAEAEPPDRHGCTASGQDNVSVPARQAIALSEGEL